MASKLNDICSYAKGKTAVAGLTAQNYISTENMLPNKGGITTATNLPSVDQTQAYRKNDVLVSNIRPYFKKIWQAEYDGGCSNDVLVFRAAEGVDPIFLYYVLADDTFFNYATATSKGTKMPRGDKSAIMEYGVPTLDIEVQRKIGALLRSIDQKIAINSKINDNLQQQAQTLFAEHFCLRGGDSIPDGWSLISLGDVAVISNKSFNPLKQPETMLEHYSIPAFDETRYPVFELSTAIKSNKFVVDEDCFMISKLNPTTKRVWRPYCITENAVCSTEFIVYKAKKRELTDFLYSLIDSASFSDFMCSHVTGSTGSRQRTTPSDTLQYQFYMPTTDEIADFSASVAPMYATIRINALENARLKELRDSLLPRLMSGDIDVSEVSI